MKKCYMHKFKLESLLVGEFTVFWCFESLPAKLGSREAGCGCSQGAFHSILPDGQPDT